MIVLLYIHAFTLASDNHAYSSMECSPHVPKSTTSEAQNSNQITNKEKYAILWDITKTIRTFYELDTSIHKTIALTSYINSALLSDVFKSSLEKIISPQLTFNDIYTIIYILYQKETQTIQLVFDGILRFMQNKSEEECNIFNDAVIAEINKKIQGLNDFESEGLISNNTKNYIYKEIYKFLIFKCFDSFKCLEMLFQYTNMIFRNLSNSNIFSGKHSNFIFSDIICR